MYFLKPVFVILSFLWLLTVDHSDGVEVIPNNGAPYQVLLNIFRNSDHYICSGSIISKSWLLTAAHCLDKLDIEMNWSSGSDHGNINNNINAVIATIHPKNFTMTSALEYEADRIVVHPKYNETTMRNDIALVKVKSRFQWSDQVRPVELYQNAGAEPEGTAVVSAWAWDTHRLRTSKVTLNQTICREEELRGTFQTNSTSYDFDENLMLCTDDGDIGSCKGDSGSPLTLKGKQIGIVSYGPDDCAPPNFAVYTRVTAYVEWIQESCCGCLDYYMGKDKNVKEAITWFEVSPVAILGLVVVLIAVVGRMKSCKTIKTVVKHEAQLPDFP